MREPREYNRKYPKFVGVGLELKTYAELMYAARDNERRAAQQARYWIKQGLAQWKIERICEWMAGYVR